MLRRLLLAFSILFVLAHQAHANGRPPGTSTISFRPGANNEIAAGMTFGLLFSKDSGATWQWMCEDAIGYGGMYDPDYVYTADGSLFATTFDGLQVSRDGCTFTNPFGKKFVSTVSQDSDGNIYFGAADGMSPTNPGDAKIYRSTDGGTTFLPMAGSPGIVNDWWQSLEAAPSNPERVYLSGYRFVPDPNGGTGKVKQFLFFRSNNGGAMWTEFAPTDIVTMPNSTIEIAGISHTNPDLVFARVKLADNSISDAIWRSTDGGENWTRVLDKGGSIAFLVRKTGQLVAATQALGSVVSNNDGAMWTELVNPPHINCLAENEAGELWACTQNFGSMGSPSDNFGIMKTRDLATWTGVLKFQDIKEPVSCADGTVQKNRCDGELWCGLCVQIGCDPNRPACAIAGDTDNEDPKDSGCCQGAPPAPGALLLGLGVFGLLLRRRRS